jgi:hypothetical protein
MCHVIRDVFGETTGYRDSWYNPVIFSVSYMANCNEDNYSQVRLRELSRYKPSRYAFDERDQTPSQRQVRQPECSMPVVDWWIPRLIHG